jgi:hypothetical protein
MRAIAQAPVWNCLQALNLTSPAVAPVSRLNSMPATFNTHTSNAPAAHRKSQYAHCSRPALAEHGPVGTRRAFDWTGRFALEIHHERKNLSFARRCLSILKMRELSGLAGGIGATGSLEHGDRFNFDEQFRPAQLGLDAS